MSTPTGTTLDIPIAAYPDIEPRLLRFDGAEDLDAYVNGGGYAALRDPGALLDQVAAAGLRGRGGAAFPIARKIATVRGSDSAPILVANGEEGEPSSVKDKWLLRNRPHLVLDGLRLAAAMSGAERAYVYVSDSLAADSIERALSDHPGQGRNDLDIAVHRVRPAYVAGEETAAVRSLNGGPALPSDKPPRPFERGVDDRPTQVSNVETLSNLPLIHTGGSAWYRTAGTSDSSGTYLMTLSTSAGTVLAEVPFGVTLREVLAWRGHDTPVTGALMGGYFAGLLSSRVLDLPLEYVAVAAAGSGLGCGAVGVLDEDTCPVTVAGGVLQYFAANNAGQCGSCFNGTAAMAAVVTGLRLGRARQADIDRLRRWSASLRGRGACGTLDGATNAAATLLREFPDAVESHLGEECAPCITAGEHLPAPFAVHGY